MKEVAQWNDCVKVNHIVIILTDIVTAKWLLTSKNDIFCITVLI